MKIYLIGSINNQVGSNKAQYDDIAEGLRNKGYVVLNPFDNYEVGQSTLSKQEFLRERMKMLIQCDSAVIINDISRDRHSMYEKDGAHLFEIPVRSIDELKNLNA